MVKIEDCKAMTDHFDGIDKLVKEAPHTEGAPNFRRVSLFWKPGVNFTHSANVLAERVWRKQFHQQNCYQLASKHN